MDTGDTNYDRDIIIYNDGIDDLTCNTNISIGSTPGLGHDIAGDDWVSNTSLNDDGQETKTILFDGNQAGEYSVPITAVTMLKGINYSYTRIITVDVENVSTDEGDEDTGNLGAATPCITNASCSTSQWCYGGSCVAVSCATGYYASDHVCKLRAVYQIDITGYDRSISIGQGGSLQRTVSVRNTGNQNLSVSLAVEITDGDGINASAEPSAALALTEETVNFTVNITAAASVAIGNYTGKFKATSTSTAKDTATFTLVVAPTGETQQQIQALYDNYSLLVQQLSRDFEAVKLAGAVNASNLTLLEAKVNATLALIASSKEALDSGNYAQAQAKLNELASLLNQTRTFMAELGVTGALVAGDFWNNLMMWLVVGIVVVGAAGLLMYMMVPAKGYTHGKGYSASGKAGPLNRLSDGLFCLKARLTGGRGGGAKELAKRCGVPAYGEGYKRIDSFAAGAKEGGRLSGIKNVFRRKR